MGEAKRPRPDSSGAILDALPDVVLLVSDGQIVDANVAAEATLANGSALDGVALREVLADDEWRRLELTDAQRARGWTVPATYRLRFSRLDGTSMMADVRWQHLPGGRVVLVARDVTDVTRAEDLMGKLAQLPSGMDGPGALLDASEVVFAELGWKVAFTEIVDGGSVTVRMIAPAHDPVGDYGRSLVGRFVPREETPVLAEVVRSGEPLFLDNLPSLQKGPIGAAVALSASMDRARVGRSAWCPIRVSGRLTHLLAVTGADITEHDFVAIQLFSAQLGAALRLQALRMGMVHRERLAAVGEMAAVLAHEVRNPLGVMFTALSTLSRAEPGKSAEWRPLLAILQEEADRLQRLVTDLLEFSSSSTPAVETTDLRPIVLDALLAAQHDPAFAVANPRVTVAVPEGLQVRTDRVLMRRVLINIVVNAFQHVQPGGSVEVVARAEHREVFVTVSNDGSTLRPDVARRAFEPFFTTKPAGTGLGLAIVRRVCTDVGARVDIEARDVGAAFTVTMPGDDS